MHRSCAHKTKTPPTLPLSHDNSLVFGLACSPTMVPPPSFVARSPHSPTWPFQHRLKFSGAPSRPQHPTPSQYLLLLKGSECSRLQFPPCALSMAHLPPQRALLNSAAPCPRRHPPHPERPLERPNTLPSLKRAKWNFTFGAMLLTHPPIPFKPVFPSPRLSLHHFLANVSGLHHVLHDVLRA